MEMDIESVRDKWMSQNSALYPVARLEVITPGIESNLPAYEIHFFSPSEEKPLWQGL